MKRLVWVLTLLLLLTACKSGGETAASPSSPPAPAASFTPEPTSDPDAPWWERLTAGDLPTALAAAEDLSGTGEQCFMLGQDPDISLYGVAGEDVVLLRRGETLAAFEQVYRAQPQAVLPELWWMDLDGDGAEELAVRCGTITNELLSRLGRRLELQKVPRSSQSSGRSAETRG